jgi:serine/threonine protein kinase
MSSWKAVNELFHRALDLPVAERDAFLDRECAGNPGLRAEVASLLAAHSDAGDFIEKPAGDMTAYLSQPGAHTPGTMIGPYRIVDVIGEGGMGIVYRAEDTRLGRVVALKSVAPKFIGDETRRERLRREARAAALLNHPGIATVYALDEIDGEVYIATEYVPGETLREELQRTRPSLKLTVDTALEIARALAAAHERGIVHRDLKPENVMRADSGHVKILDFGLARLTDDAAGISFRTADGSRLGTPAYMAPEQIRGQEVDFRADLFSFGVMLHEFAGAHPFATSDPAGTIARVLESEPPSMSVARPPGSGEAAGWRALEVIAGVCLRKSPGARYQSTAELIDALETARGAVSGAPVPSDVLMPAAVTAADPLAWWRFHQIATISAYAVMLVPIGYLSEIKAIPLALYLVAMVAALVSGAMRLHLWFTQRWNPGEWASVRTRTLIWVRLSDATYVFIQLAVGYLVMDDHSRLSALLIATGVACLIAFAVVEPATTRAAFREPGT